MGRNRIHESPAARSAAYRKRALTKDERLAAKEMMRLITWKENNAEKYKESIRCRAQRRRFDETSSRSFIAIDGEGYNVLHTHLYTMLSSSEGHTLEDWSIGLSTASCFNFLFQYHNKGILVGFYTGYDVNMMLRDVPHDKLIELWNYGYCKWYDWHIEWMPGKMFKLRRDGKQIVWFDVSAFFQTSFIKSLQGWNIEVPQEIIEGKEQRGKFTKKEREKVKSYNLKECELLVELMNKLRQMCLDVGYLPRSWHGAGALANEILKKNNVAEYNYYDAEHEEKFLAAYYGGRNQVLQQGEFDRAYTHDINSAYPYALTLLPTTYGTWRKIGKVMDLDSRQFLLYKLKWKIPPSKATITPFPFRFKQSIYWPFQGGGWYWQPEVEQAMKYYAKYIKILEVWEFTPTDDVKPFAFITDLYNERRRLLKLNHDGQIVLKLGYNACYGKVAQSIGYNGSNPPYQNYFWAGYITSKTRAMVFDLAMKSPESVISFATDGVMADNKLAIHDITKRLGEWSVDEVSNLLILQPGVYTYDGAEHKPIFKSRGFAAKSVDYDKLRIEWREQGVVGIYKYKEWRFVGIGNCINSGFRNWRRWFHQPREINFEPNGDTTLATGKNLRVYPQEKLDAEWSEAYKKKSSWIDEELSDSVAQ